MVVVDILLKVASVGVWLATILSLVLPAGFVSKQHKQACHGLAASGTAPPRPFSGRPPASPPAPAPCFSFAQGFFTWHPILMTTSFVLLMSQGLVAYISAWGPVSPGCSTVEPTSRCIAACWPGKRSWR